MLIAYIVLRCLYVHISRIRPLQTIGSFYCVIQTEYQVITDKDKISFIQIIVYVNYYSYDMYS